MPGQQGFRDRTGSAISSTQTESSFTTRQRQSETALPNGAAPAQRRVADHPNRHWSVIEPESAYTPPTGLSHGHIIIPSTVSAVLAANEDQLDQLVGQLVAQEAHGPGNSDSGALRGQPLTRKTHERSTGHHTAGKSPIGAATSGIGTQYSHGEGFFQRDSGMSPDGFPSRSMEEGGVSGLSQRESVVHASDSVASAAASSCASTSSSGLTADPELQTARVVTVRPARVDHPRPEVTDRSLLPSLAGIGRMDRRIEEALRLWEDVPVVGQDSQTSMSSAGVTGQPSESDDEMLTVNRQDLTTGLKNAPTAQHTPVARGDGHPVPSSTPRAHHVQARPPRGSRADANQSAERAQRRALPSPSPSDFSIAETVFDVRRRTPPPAAAAPRRSDLASLPSRRPGGLQRGSRGPREDARPAFGSGRMDDVPAVLVPGGWLGIGGDHDPLAQVSRRRDRDGPDSEERRHSRGTR
ncbi:hypothetical protein diail_7436 [Diaporthe ilicicola]|nr:hypothetical protein diail_7436 [Diaporthe ilicicola]